MKSLLTVKLYLKVFSSHICVLGIFVYFAYVCVSGGKKCLFFGKFGMLCFVETPVLRFTLLSYYCRIKE